MVKLVEEGFDDRKDWATFHHKGLLSTLKRAKKLKNVGKVVETQDHLEILMDTQLTKADGKKGTKKEPRITNTGREPRTTVTRPPSDRVLKDMQPRVVIEQTEALMEEPLIGDADGQLIGNTKGQKTRQGNGFVIPCEKEADTKLEKWIIQHVFRAHEYGVIASSYLGGIAQVPDEVRQVEDDPAYLWLMEHIGKTIAVHQTMKETFDNTRIAKLKHQYRQSLIQREARIT